MNTMKRLKRLIVLIGCIGLVGCASSINTISDNYAESSKAVRHLAEISGHDWLFGSGIIQGALNENNAPAWLFEELKKVDAWFIDENGNEMPDKKLTDSQLGYTVGVRFRLSVPIIKAIIQQYAPGILGVTEVKTILAFLGV